MLRTNFFNVGHGEAILLELPGLDKYEKHFVLRDFGRSKSAKLTENCCTPKQLIRQSHFYHPCLPFYPLMKINREHRLHWVRFDAMLSHAHDDHFNGFKLMYEDGLRKIFDNAYIPFLPLNDLTELGGLLIKYSIFFYRFYGPETIEGVNAKNWLIATPTMMALSDRMWCLEQGLTLHDWSASTKILWPSSHSKESAEYFSSRWSKYVEDNGLDTDFLNEDTEKVRKILTKYFRQTKSDRRLDAPDDAMSVYSSFEYAICDNDILEIQKILGDGYNEDQILLYSNPELLYESHYKVNLDDHSLMFEIEHEGRKDLYLSDAHDKTVLDMLNSAKINEYAYHLIKSSHHGNRGSTALRKCKIKSEITVNCCGPANKVYAGPDASYTQISKRVICLDWWDKGPKWKNKSVFEIHDDCCLTI